MQLIKDEYYYWAMLLEYILTKPQWSVVVYPYVITNTLLYRNGKYKMPP